LFCAVTIRLLQPFAVDSTPGFGVSRVLLKSFTFASLSSTLSEKGS